MATAFISGIRILQQFDSIILWTLPLGSSLIRLCEAMSEVDGSFVKRGLWTNYDEGVVIGKTITTDNKTGIIIVALMAVMSTIG